MEQLDITCYANHKHLPPLKSPPSANQHQVVTGWMPFLPPNQRAKAGDRSINALNGKFYHGQTLMKQVTADIYFFLNGVKLHVTINSVKSTQVNDYYITVKTHGNKYNH